MKSSARKSLTVLALLAGAWPLLAQTVPAPSTAGAPPAKSEMKPSEATKLEEVVVLTPFEVTATKDNGYQATETLAGTRIRTDLKDVAGALSVYTKDFLNDIGATDAGTLLQFTTNAEVAGTRGTYAGLGNGTSVNETATLRAPGGTSNRVRGLAAADSTRDFFVTDIPWDSFNVDRVDIQRGPNSILFGLGSPAGIQNTTTRNAEFRDKNEVVFRTGSYGSIRTSLDTNQQLIKNVLSIRFDGLVNDQKYEQKQAYSNDQRFYGALRFDPQLFKDKTARTSIKVKYENGDVTADRPRIVPPADSITPWFRAVNNTSLTGGAGKLVVSDPYAIGANPAAINPWLTGFADQQQPIWFIDGTTNNLYKIYGGYINSGALNNNGTNRGPGNSLIGQRFSGPFYGLTSLSTFATNAKVPGYQYGQFRQQSLLDSSVFDFYHNLIDGPTSSQFEKWNAYNIDVSQTAFDDRLGIQLNYDRQKYKRGGQALLGNPTLTVDVLQTFQDLSANPNFGRPYVAGGPGNGNSYESDRKYVRASVFGEIRAKDYLSQGSFLAKLLGKHRFNGVYSNEQYYTENRSWQMYANSQAWDAYWNQTDGSTSGFKTRPPLSAIYLGSSVAGLSSAAGANIPGITAPVVLQSGNVYNFNATYKNPVGVNLTDPWTVPANLLTVFDPTQATTQASNPANYVGWSNFQDALVTYGNGLDPTLTTVAQKSLRVTKSYAGSWQGFLWNDAIVPTLGWRYDEVKSKGVTAPPVTANRGSLNLSPSVYTLPDTYPVNQIFKDHSTAGGIVVHLNKLFGERDPLPVNVSLAYNKSSNFQVTDTRRDIYGNPIANPTGATKDYSVLISTKDGKYSFRAVKYETSVQNGSTQLDLSGFAGMVNQGVKFRNVFLYQMSGYTWDTREQTNNTPGQRFFWTPAYVDAGGRPVADLNGNGGSTAGTTLETQAQADAHRDAVIRAWNDIQKTLTASGYFGAWNYGTGPTTLSALTDRATYAATLTLTGSPDGKPIPSAQYQPVISSLANYSPTAPQGLAVTADTQSKGYEFELTANPTPNWRITFNAAQTVAVRTNVGGPVLDALVAYMDTQMAGIAGDMRQFNGNYVANNEVRQNWANWRGQYTLLKLQEGSAASELRKWRYNVVTNYSFTHGKLKGAGVGGGYRWQDKVVIGYPVIPGTGTLANFDLTKPYYGPTEGAIDLWASYERKLTKKINWKIQANVSNAGKHNRLIPISVEPDGMTWAAARVAPVQEWFVTNTFSF